MKSIRWTVRSVQSDQHVRRRPCFGRFCALEVTCSREPVSFSHLMYALLSMHATCLQYSMCERMRNRTGI